MTNILGIDVGGTGIKAALVDTDAGSLVSDKRRIDTPNPSTPKNVAATVKQLVAAVFPLSSSTVKPRQQATSTRLGEIHRLTPYSVTQPDLPLSCSTMLMLPESRKCDSGPALGSWEWSS